MAVSAMGQQTAKRTVAFLTVPESTGSTLYGMYDLFASVDRDWGLVTRGETFESPFRPVTVAAEPGSFRMANGVHVLPDTTFAGVGIPDIVCVPELLVPPETDISGRYSREVAWLKACYAQGSYLGTACSGALMLAEAGLLDGCEATTHWAYCDVMARRYPAVRVEPHRALVTAGDGQRIVMVGGGSSWQDLALFLIARIVGLERALQVAKVYLIDWHHVGQQPYAVLSCHAQVEDSVIARCQRWLAEHYDDHHPVRAMTRLSGLPERSFKRRFRRATGINPIEYVQTLRLEEAKQCLEMDDAPVEIVAAGVGYEDVSFFNRLFRRRVGLTPAQYRKRFGALKRTLADQHGENADQTSIPAARY
jgi:transcriptional regulator GlxA family with amidase domain